MFGHDFFLYFAAVFVFCNHQKISNKQIYVASESGMSETESERTRKRTGANKQC